MTAAFKSITKIIETTVKKEGVGAQVRRSIGTRQLRNLDPFLLLDEFSARKPAGFPGHPHRGLQTVTYMLDGVFQHEDFKGHKGTIGPGDLQWMTAGRGIVHAEMPKSDTTCTMPKSETTSTGLQLWLNLPSKDKMMEPKYQELFAKDVPLVSLENGEVNVKVIAGEFGDVKTKVHTNSPIFYLDVDMKSKNFFEMEIPANWTAFVYTLSGTGYFGNDAKEIPLHAAVLFDKEGRSIKVQTKDADARFVLFAGEPINEPIARDSLFVMNNAQELKQAWNDYYNQRNGFEGAQDFVSKIAKHL